MQRFAFGLDISDRSAEFVSLLSLKGRVVVDRYGRMDMPPGVINRGVISDPDKLVAVLSSFLDEFIGPKRSVIPVGISLQEVLVYSKVFSLPANLDPIQAAKAVLIEAADRFPIAMAEAATSLVPVYRDKEQQELLFSAVPKEVVKSYNDVLTRSGIRPLFFDSEALAMARAVIVPRDPEPVLIADIGARTTSMDIWDNGGIRYTSAVPVAGDNLTSAIEIQRGIPLDQAEQSKQHDGLDPSAGDGRSFLILQRPVGEIIAEIKRTIDYYERQSGRKVRQITLAGGTSLVPFLTDYISSNLTGMKVTIGNPLRGISIEQLPNVEKFTKTSILYATAIGLALRALGTRICPGADIAWESGKSSRGTAFIGRLRQSAASLIAMVTHKKTTHPKKKRHAIDGVSAKGVSDVPSGTYMTDSAPEQSAAVVAPVPAREPAKEIAVASAEAIIEPKETVEESKDVSVTDVAAPVEAEETSEGPADFGRGIGDILGSAYSVEGTTEEEPVEEDEIGPTKPSYERMAIHSILKKSRSPVADDDVAGGGRRGSRPLTAFLALLVLLFLAAAIAGVIMFVRKNGLPAMPSFKKADVQAPAVPVAKSNVPASVSEAISIGLERKVIGDRSFVLGRIVEVDVVVQDSFPTTGQTASASGKSRGMIKIINTTSKPYAFVATTRFLTADGVLFRMDKSENIPANGEVVVAVTADKAGADGDIGPGDFIIPGLSKDLQDKVYGKSDAAMTGGAGTAKAVGPADLTAAKAKLTEKLQSEGNKDVTAALSAGEKFLSDLLTSTEVSFTAPDVGTAGATFTAKLTLRFRALVIPEKDVVAALEEKLKAALPVGTTMADVELGNIQYSVEAYPPPFSAADIRVEATIKSL